MNSGGHATRKRHESDVIHWAGGATVVVHRVTTEWLPGWPCCCCGKRARTIHDSGKMTVSAWEVTCKLCLATMRRAGISTEDTRVHQRCVDCLHGTHILAERCERCGGRLRMVGWPPALRGDGE